MGLFFVVKRTRRSSLFSCSTLARRRILAHGFASQNLFLSHGQSNMDEKFIGENFSPEEKPAAMHCFSCLMPLFVDMTATEMMCGGQREGSFSSFHRIQAQGHFEMFLYFVKMTQTFSRLNQVARGNFSNRLSSIPTRLAPHFAIFKSIRLQLPSYSTT